MHDLSVAHATEGDKTRPHFEADAKLRRLYNAIENGVADLSDLMLKERVTELKRSGTRPVLTPSGRRVAIERLGPAITIQSIKKFARTGRKRMRIEGGGYRGDYLRALTQRVEVDAKELRIEKRTAVPSSPLQAQQRRVLAFRALYRSGAPEEIRTPDP